VTLNSFFLSPPRMRSPTKFNILRVFFVFPVLPSSIDLFIDLPRGFVGMRCPFPSFSFPSGRNCQETPKVRLSSPAWPIFAHEVLVLANLKTLVRLKVSVEDSRGPTFTSSLVQFTNPLQPSSSRVTENFTNLFTKQFPPCTWASSAP